MKLIYECEKLAILQGDERYIIHVLNDYRLVKEIIVNKNDLIPTLKKELNIEVVKKRFVPKKKKIGKNIYFNSELDNIKKTLKLI